MYATILSVLLMADPVQEERIRVFLPETAHASSHDSYNLKWPGPKQGIKPRPMVGRRIFFFRQWR